MKTGKYLLRMTPIAWTDLMFNFKKFKKLMKKPNAMQTIEADLTSEVERVSRVLLKWKGELQSMMMGEGRGIFLAPPPVAPSPISISSDDEPLVDYATEERSHLPMLHDSQIKIKVEHPDFMGTPPYIPDVSRRAESLAGPPADALSNMQQMSTKELDKIADKLADIGMFLYLNRLALQKITKKIDKTLNQIASNQIVPHLQEQGHLLITLDTVPFLLTLSKAYIHVRKNASKVQEQKEFKAAEAKPNPDQDKMAPLLASAATSSKPGDTGNAVKTESGSELFLRSTAKYWIPLDKVPRFVLEVIKNLPLYMFDEKSSAWISSVYLDSPDLGLYHKRIRREDGAKAARIRWYGDNVTSPLFLERKIHRENWTGAPSVKERLPLSYDEVVGWLSGADSVKQHISKTDLGKEVVQMTDELGLVPTVKTACQRLAFQNGKKDASVRLSLDTDLTLSPAGLPPWSTHLPHPDQIIFPFAVLEVKLQVAEPPAWLDDILKQPWVQPVPNFSKFLQAVFCQYPDRCRQKPYWNDYVATLVSRVIETTEGPQKESLSRGEDDDSDKEEPKPKKNWLSSLFGSKPKHVAFADEADYKLLGDVTETKDGINGYASGPVVSSAMIESSSKSKAGKKKVKDESSDDEDDGSRKEKKEGSKKGSGWSAFFDRSWLFRKPSQNKKIQEAPALPPSLPMKIEPKTYFANERTFIRWATTGIHLLGIAIAVQVFSSYNPKNTSGEYNVYSNYALYVMMVLPVLVVLYGLAQYLWRDRNLKSHKYSVVGDRWGPVVLSILLLGAMGTLIFFILTSSSSTPVVAHGPNCTAALIGPVTLYNPHYMPIGGIRSTGPNSNFYVASRGYLLNFNALNGVPSTPYTAYMVDPSPGGVSRPFHAIEVDSSKTSSLVFLSDASPNNRTVVVVDSNNNFLMTKAISVEHIFLTGDTGSFSGLTLMGRGSDNSYQFLLSGSFNFVYKVSVPADLSTATLVNIFPLRNVTEELASAFAAGNFTMTISPELAPTLSPFSVSSLHFSAGTLYTARDKGNMLDLYTLTSKMEYVSAPPPSPGPNSTVPVGPSFVPKLTETLGWAASLSYPSGVSEVQGIDVQSTQLLLSSKSGVYNVWWRPQLLFGCYYGYNQTAL